MTGHVSLLKEIDRKDAKIERLEAQNAVLMYALDLYADTSSWGQSLNSSFTQLFSKEDCDNHDGELVGGKRARAAIARCEEIEKGE